MLGSRFDWYELTADGVRERWAAHELARWVGGTVSEGKPRNGYRLCLVVERDATVLCEVYGQSARAGEVHLKTSGHACDEMVPHLRDMFPEHRVSRVDVSVDFEADFGVLDGLALAFSEDHGLRNRLITDSEGGATRYLGSAKSEVQVRVYKKSEQLRALDPSRAAMVPDGIVRAEIQVRPGKRDVKARVASLTPDAVWGVGKWTQAFAAELLGVVAPRTVTHSERPTNWMRTLATLKRQYRKGAQARMAEVGREQVVRELLEAFGLDEGKGSDDQE